MTESAQIEVAATVGLLEEHGPNLKHPYSSGVNGSAYTHMRELRIQQGGQPYRVLYAFDPRRTAILLIGGNKTGNNQWYEQYIAIADDLYKQHLATLKKEESINE